MEVSTRVGRGRGQERVWECRGRGLARAQAMDSGHEQGGRFAIADGVKCALPGDIAKPTVMRC